MENTKNKTDTKTNNNSNPKDKNNKKTTTNNKKKTYLIGGGVSLVIILGYLYYRNKSSSSSSSATPTGSGITSYLPSGSSSGSSPASTQNPIDLIVPGINNGNPTAVSPTSTGTPSTIVNVGTGGSIIPGAGGGITGHKRVGVPPNKGGKTNFHTPVTKTHTHVSGGNGKKSGVTATHKPIKVGVHPHLPIAKPRKTVSHVPHQVVMANKLSRLPSPGHAVNTPIAKRTVSKPTRKPINRMRFTRKKP
jgi:hypothetical protein